MAFISSGRLSLFLSFTLAGTSVIAVRFLPTLKPFTITACSLLLALLLLLPFCAANLVCSLRQLRKADWMMIGLQAFFGIFLFRAFLLVGLHFTSSMEAGIMIGCAPALTCLFIRIALREKAGRIAAAGILCTLVGLFLIQGIQWMKLSTSSLVGNALVLCAAASEALFSLLSRIQATRKKSNSCNKLTPLEQSLLVSALALAACLPLALFEHPVSSLVHLDVQGWLSLVWYGLVVTLLSYVLWYRGVKRCSGYTAAAYSSLMPFSSMLFSYFLLKETISGVQWLGGGAIVMGILVIAKAKTNEQIAA
ncbi:DMT family transporter [Gorillibacterium sp. CAU 1737]|uniref:DMT family transporter n=1 Tax=Gorillibacterium sp. CAU 1737 TaxID=3140362 RepID=UPI003260C7B9